MDLNKIYLFFPPVQDISHLIHNLYNYINTLQTSIIGNLSDEEFKYLREMFSNTLKFYNSMEACCDEFCSKISKEFSYFLLGLRKKTQNHKMDVSQIFIG